MSTYFITGAGTDIGKTWLACALLRHWRSQGETALAAYKPLLSGFDPQAAAASDAGLLLAALGREADAAALDAINPWRFAAPLAPDMAAACEGRRIDFAALVEFSRRAAQRDGRVLIECVGGAMVPIDETHTVRDWIAATRQPAILVGGSYLGSLSHTLTALESLSMVGVEVTVIAVNETPGAAVALDATVDCLRRHAGGVPVTAIARVAPAVGVARLAELLTPEPRTPFCRE